MSNIVSLPWHYGPLRGTIPIVLVVLVIFGYCFPSIAMAEETLTLPDCFNLLYKHSVEIQVSSLKLNIQRREFEKVLNKFNLGLNTGYNISSSERGGSSADSSLFGTSRSRDTLSLGFEQPLETGGNLGLDYSL